MKLKTFQPLLAIVLLLPALLAHAAVTCTNPTSTGFSTAYSTTGPSVNSTQGTVSFSCTRTAAGDVTSLLLRANSGLNATGTQNRGKSGANFIKYEGMQDSVCSVVWTNNNAATSIPVTLAPVVNTAQPLTFNFWGCVTALQAVPNGTYTDTVTVTVRNNGGAAVTYSTGTFPVSIVVPASCSMTTGPGTLTIPYTSFQASAATGTTTFSPTCTLNLPYTMAVSPASGTLVGIAYTLSLPASSTGTGALQTHTITGTAAAGQSGTCNTASCSAVQSTTLTITY